MPQARLTMGMLLSLAVLIAGCGGGGDGRSGEAVQEPPPTSPGPPDPPAPPPDPNPPEPEPPAATAGLDARPSNTTCIAPARATGGASIGTQRVFPNLSFRNPGSRNPLLMIQAPRDSSRWFVAERFGVVRVFENNQAVAAASVFLDIGARVDATCSECGLLGMAFHPDFPTTPRAYVAYTSTVRSGRGPDTHLSEFTSPDNGLTLDPASERTLITIHKGSVHHHGGGIIFGRDGYLYFATGDGNVTRPHAQDLRTLLGKILRIDIRNPAGSALYGVPADNPFASSTAACYVNGESNNSQNCPEIWAWGLRNPWRWSFDRETGDLWLGDVGESEIEEVNRVVRGGNYGWRCFEGDVSTGNTCGTPVGPMLPPIAQYSHELGQAVTGGYVYRGTAIPGLVGQYLFADFVSGRIWSIPNDTAPTLTVTDGFDSGLNVSSFAEDHDGELYVVNMQGNLHRITGSGGASGGVATELSATGCVDPANPTLPASGLIPYEPTAPFWSDGAAKERWIALPDGQNITVGSEGDWDFPNGTVLMKNFRLDNRLIETRLFMRHPDGIWAGYSYEWNAQGTDATLVRGGKQVTIGSQTWIYPSGAQCMQCHTEAAGFSLGLETKQLASNITYPQTGRAGHQLVTLSEINTIAPPIADPAAETAYPNPTGTGGTLTERARSYLHTNCAQCHRPGGPTTANMDLRYSTALAQTNACDVAPGLGELGITNARIIAPGAANRSVIPARMSLRDHPDAMPPIGTRVDTEGVQLISEWINSLTSCN